MNPKEVKKWQANGIVAIAVNPFNYVCENGSDFMNETKMEFELRKSKFNDFEQWRNDLANQPLTSLVGEFDAEDVEVVEKWEFRVWDEDNEIWFDWVFSTKYYCNTLKGKHETRQSYELIRKVKEVLHTESKYNTVTRVLSSYDCKVIDETVYYEDKFVQNAMQEYSTQQTEPLIKALKDMSKEYELKSSYYEDYLLSHDPIYKAAIEALKEVEK